MSGLRPHEADNQVFRDMYNLWNPTNKWNYSCEKQVLQRERHMVL